MIYKCTVCAKECKNAIGLSGHMRSHKEDVKPEEKQSEPSSLTVLREKAAAVEKAKAEADKAVQVADKQFSEYAEAMKDQKPVETVKVSMGYKTLPPPVVEALERTYGNWLTQLDIGQAWRKDFGGYAIYIKVPKHMSTEWKTVTTLIYDNATKKVTGERKDEIPDDRWCSLKDIPEALKWLDKVKSHIMVNAYRRGITLPSTNTGIDQTRQTLQEYEKSLAGIK